MSTFEYKVVPAPTVGLKQKGVDTPEGRFAHAFQISLNELATEGWEFQRAECLPSIERSGLTAKTTRNRHMLVFRRAIPATAAAAKPDAATAVGSPPLSQPETPEDDASQSAGARQMLRDNGVEELSDVAGLTSSLQALASARKSTKTND